jgi:hypothetical protein
MNVNHSGFVSGWINACDRYVRGESSEEIEQIAERMPPYFGNGMRTALEAITGDIEEARRICLTIGISEARIASLVELTTHV